ncbi:methyltransferase [Terasakiispira papahanaumokuakeensis]|uniref:Prepilin leader peptidase/N-methyltransferase n=1 Tax=Terasakiispira papahanaumokuakeensis TaxID=197479 RepID=A0A1E2VD05_9GAMM|nr:methyltransferase [Terasakiispira papahanaumokuakeensis]
MLLDSFWIGGLWGILGLCLGSFLNVVVARLPVMMAQRWHAEACEALSMPEEAPTEPFNLAVPASHCPHCQTPLRWHDNLPLIGYLKRRGRCAHCQGPISMQYPLVELAGGLLGLVVWWWQGSHLMSLALFGACLALLALALIDARTQLLPDALTLPLLWAGLLFQLCFQPWQLSTAVIGAMSGYLSLWSLYWAFRLLTGKEGLGYGDFKLLAALGAWLGWQVLPLLLLWAAAAGIVIGGLWQWRHPDQRGQHLPFGPYLAGAGILFLITGDAIMQSYARWIFG